MSRLARWGSATTLAASAFLLVAAPSYAGGGLQRCLDQSIDHGGELPVCTKAADGTWVASWPDGSGVPGDGTGIPGWFVALFVLAIVVGIGVTVWKVSTARKLATQSGMDPGLATQMTLLTENGLDATYLASSLRQQSPTIAPPTAGPTHSRAGTRRVDAARGAQGPARRGCGDPGGVRRAAPGHHRLRLSRATRP